jgi:NADP-dependent 3-hydroxy acid dehydrogenase YdfG
MTAEEILTAVQKRIISKIMFTEAGSKSRAEIEQLAIDEVAAELRMHPKSILKSTEAAAPSMVQSDNAQIKADASYMREYLMRPIDASQLDDICDASDEDLRKFVGELE